MHPAVPTQNGGGRRTRPNPDRENTLHKDIPKPRAGLVFWQGRPTRGTHSHPVSLMDTMIRRIGSALRSGVSVLGTALALFVCASFFATAALGQGAGPPTASVQEDGEGTWHDDVLRIKLSPSMADAAQPVKRNGTALLGISSVDALNTEYNATSIEPLFDVGGEYAERHREYGLHRWYEIRLEDGMAATDASVQSVAQQYSSVSAVTVAEGKARARLIGTDANAQASSAQQQAADPQPLINPPDDPLYDDQYGFENIEAQGGWVTQTGDTSVVVSVHDSGIELDHPDLFPNIWYGGDPNDGTVHGKAFDGDPEAIQDFNGHGTHVTGTMAAATNNDFGVAGTAGGNGEYENGRGTGVRYMVTTPIGEEDSYVYAADNGAAISQNSWGYVSPGVFPQSMQDAIDYFIDNGGGDQLDGGLVVFAAGNDGSDAEYFPGAYDPVVAVASTNQNDNVSGFSNYGEWVDIAAPGSSVLSTWLVGQGSVEDNYEYLSGTSMAAPHVSGAAALVVSEFPGISSPEQVESTLEQAADDIGASVDIGAGRLNLAQALQEDDGQPPVAVTDLSVTDVAAAHVDLEWTVPEGNPAVYDIRYSTDPIENDSDFEDAQQVEDPPTPPAPGETDTAVIDGLTPDTEYFFAVKTSDTFGNTSDLSNVPSATTENAPAIALDPEEVNQTLAVGETGTNSFSILNAGKDTLTYTLAPALGGTQISDPIGETQTPASEANFPEGNYETTMGPAPENGEPVANTAPVQKLNADLEGSSYYGVNFGSETSFVSFEGGTPETLNILSSYPSDAFSNAGDFPRDDDSFVYELDIDGVLRQVDVETGEFTEIGNVGQGDWAGMSTDPTSGTIYVNTGTTLYTLDPDAPSVEEIGSFGVDFMIDIAVDGQGQMYGYSVSTDAFYEIDKQTGEATQVGSIGFDANFGQGLTWDTQNQVMLMAAFNNANSQPELRTVNRETGSTELVGVLGENSPSGTDQLGWIATPISATGEWLAAEPAEGEVPEGEPDEITLSYQTTFEEEGVLDLTGGLDYFADVEIQSNDPGTPTEQLPVTLTVNGDPAIAVSEDPLDFGSVFTGTTATDTLTVFNDSDNNILQVGSLQLEGDAFTLPDSSAFVLDPGESMAVPVRFSPTESTSYSGAISFASSAGDQEIGLSGQGTPFVSIEPDSLSQEIDLTTGDSTATQTFTVTNEFSESLPFSVLIESLESESMDITPKLSDEQLQRWRQMQQMEPQSNPNVEPSLEPAPTGQTDGQSASRGARSAAARLMSGPEVLEETGVTVYGNEVLAPEIVAFDAGLPGDFTVVDEGVDSYAGNFTFANNDQVFWIDNTDNTLKTYTLEDGSVQSVGELDPVGSDVTWSDMETDPTDGTTYVTAGEGNTNRLYELDVDDAELDLVGEYASGDLVVALAIDGEGNAYAHEIANDEILSVDLETAESEVVGSTGIDANFAQSMTYDAETGQVLMAALHNCGFFGCSDGTLRQVDRETGNTTLIGSFPDGGNDEFGWMATPGQGIPWLATNLEQGTLPAGASLQLQAEYDASQIIEGDYSAQISIVGDDLQGEPSESLPVNLSVEAAPVSFVSKDSLGYEDLFVDDTSSTQMVTLRNDGAANLNVTSVSIDSENFAFTGGTEFTLEPGDARIFDVAFTPQSVGEFTATMTIEGEEISAREVTLVGEGIPAPALSLTPTSFEKQAYVGQTQEETVEVTNTGGNPLEYDLSVLPSSPPAQSLLLEEGFGGEEFPPGDWFRAGANDGENWSTVGEDCTFYFDDPEQACFYWFPSTEGTQRLITPQLNTEDLGQVFVQFSHIIDAFSEGEFTVRLETTGDGGETWTTVKEFPAQDVGPIDEMIAIDNEDVGSDEFHVAWTFEGDSFNINGWAVDDVQVFAGGEWLAVDKTSGTIAPSESDTLNLSVDTNVPGIEEDTYQSGLGFVTNAPLAETAELPFTLNVIENLTMTMDTEGDHNPTEEFSMDFNVESLNDLEVFSYQMTMNFPADSLQIQEVVTEGTLSEGLTLASDIDNENGTLTIAASDTGTESESDGGSGSGAGLFDIEGEGVLVSVNAQAGNKIGQMDMDMEEMTFNEGNPPVNAPDKVMEIVPLHGDADLNLSINTADASSVLDFVVGKTDFIAAQETQGDVSGDGNVSAFDASLILQRTVGGIPCFPVEDGCEAGNSVLASKSSAASSETDASLAWGEVTRPKQQTVGEDESTMKLPLVLNQSAQGVRSIDVSTELDPDKVSVKDMEAQLPDSWRAVHNVSDDGTLKISMAGVSALSKTGKVATLTLKRKQTDATVEMGGNVAINEGSAKELPTKALVNIPEEFALEGAYPNPFRQAATLKMDLPNKANVTVEVYDLLGRKVKTAYNGEMSAGSGRTVRIDGSDLSSGTYFYRARVEMGDSRQTKTGKMTVVK